jgi:hypothetical protein
MKTVLGPESVVADANFEVGSRSTTTSSVPSKISA